MPKRKFEEIENEYDDIFIYKISFYMNNDIIYEQNSITQICKIFQKIRDLRDFIYENQYEENLINRIECIGDKDYYYNFATPMPIDDVINNFNFN
jgi:hypothetical protein